MEQEILVVVSRMKDYIRWKSGLNTSDRAAVPLSEIIRKACDEAIRTAERDGRRTVLDRDVPKPS
jgi:histone H3/H4